MRTLIIFSSLFAALAIAGDFTCSFYPKTKRYFCSFSVDINKGKLDSIGYC